jgi:autotransporter-associated beta strand protein
MGIFMRMKSKAISRFAFAVAMSVSFLANAQTLTLTNGVQIYTALTNTAVTMSNRCELRLTGAGNPMPGCTINLNSIDAWLFLTGVKPSVVVPTYLGQVHVSGASAVADSNCRVVQYGQNGAVVIPQPSTFRPLTVFTGAEFAGTATACSQWTYYTGTAITNISSFKLKRGYQAVLAQSANGVNYGKCYVAQDGDLEIGVLPATLDKQVQFIYVTPWRWTSKKGIGGNPPYSWLNVNWWYDWNIDQSSSHDLEYVAIWQQPTWPSLSQNWQSLGINTVLGYNEPDNPVQDAYKYLNPPGSVTNAVARYPAQVAPGLRVGSPATTDGGVSSWLFPFIQQADAAGLRVDFVAQHYYQAADPSNPSACASQMYNFLLNIWNNTHLPIWVTEWNNGANWTDNSPYPPPTYAQQQADVAAMTQMLESTPFVERYALYNWVEDTRSLVTSSNTVTPAGVTYSNLVSNLSYSQAMPDNGTRGIAEYLFATNTWDTSGYYNNGMAVGSPNYTVGHNSQTAAIALDGTNSYVQLPANIAQGSAFTFAAWVYWNGGSAWQRIFDFGSVSTTQGGTPTQYMFLTPNSGSGTLRFAITVSGNGNEQQLNTTAMASGTWTHVAVTISNNTAVLYVNGLPAVSSTSFTNTPAAFAPVKNYLGKSQFAADPLFSGELDEVEIADYAMSAGQISALYSGTPSPPYSGGVWTNDASGNWGAGNNWGGGRIANGSGYIADFSSVDLTANRTVTLDSARTIGGLRFGDLAGAQSWTLSGANTLTLDAGGANTPTIAVNQNTATISTPVSGSYGFAKTGNGTLTFDGTGNVGGGLTVNAGTVGIAGGSMTFGSGTSSVGYLAGSGNLAMTAGSLAFGGEFRVGGSDQSGSQYVATGTVTVANATLSVGSLTVARGNVPDNSISGTVTVNGGGTVVSTNDVIVEFAGTGRGKLALNGGNFIIGPTATKWLMVGYYDSGAGELDITNGTLFLENGTSLKLCRSGNTGGNAVNQAGGNVTFYSDAGVTVGGAGNLDLNYAGGASSTNTYNLNGGTLTVPQIISSASSAARIFNFNGGTLKAAAAGASFFASGVAGSANVRNNGAKIDTAGFNVTIGQALLHSAISGDSATDGGLTKNGAGTLTLGGTNTYTGTTTINAGTLALGSAASIANSRNISVAGGAVLDVSAVTGGFALGAAQTLSGSGSVNGTLANNGAIAPGAAPGEIGTLTFASSPGLNGVTLLKINRNNGAPLNDQISLPSSAVTCGGTVTVTNIGAPLQAGDVFHLFSATSYGGSFAVTNLPPLNSGLAWSNSLAANGSIAVFSTVSPVPTNIVWSMNGTNLTLSWPADHTGWRLLVQTNYLANGVSSNTNDWTTVPGSPVTNMLTLPISPALPGEYYRLAFP